MAYTTINKSTDYFNTVTYTGNGGTNAITGVGHQPDWTWIKKRNGTTWHNLYDAVRGVTKAIISNDTSAEGTRATGLTAFGADGFTVGADNNANANGDTYASWNWKANGQGSSNTAGSINTIYTSVNTTAGLSIIKYTGNGVAGATIGHGLGAVPKMLIVKQTNSSNNWKVYHVSMGNNNIMNLNDTSAQAGSTAFWNDTTPTSTLISLGTNGAINGSGDTYVMYAFTDKIGYSKIGSYIGNGNADGTFVYTGFKPAFLLSKRTDSSTGGSWILYDNKRGNNIFNPTDVVMAASNNQSESDWGTNYDCDFLSNGIKWRYNGAAGYGNTSGASYIYMAFAKNPFVANDSGTAVPVVAR